MFADEALLNLLIYGILLFLVILVSMGYTQLFRRGKGMLSYDEAQRITEIHDEIMHHKDTIHRLKEERRILYRKGR